MSKFKDGDRTITTRFAGSVESNMDHGTSLMVQHVFDDTTNECPRGHAHRDEGSVVVTMMDEDGDLVVYLDAADALVLAEFLRKAAGWILDEAAGPPDIEREAAKYTQAGEE